MERHADNLRWVTCLQSNLTYVKVMVKYLIHFSLNLSCMFIFLL